MRGRSSTVDDRVVTVHLRSNDKATRTFALTALVRSKWPEREQNGALAARIVCS
jgi:hypothetical protein